MLATIFLLVALGSGSIEPSDSSSPAASPTAVVSPAPQASMRPLREVTYDVITNYRSDDITESYAGGPNAIEPGSTSFMEGHGTITVDVFGKLADGSLEMTVTEVWKDLGRPLPFSGYVSPEGILIFNSTGPAALDDPPGELLPYFGIRFAPAGTLDTNTRWSLVGPPGKITSSTQYAVTGVSGDTVTIHKTQTIKGLGSISVDGSVVYKPSMLVAVSGTITRRTTEMAVDGQTTRTLTITFRRVSDTFDHQ